MLKKQSISKNHNGFTLVELIVVLVLMGILLSISAASLIAFQDTSRQLKKDEAAQTIFFAAQNKLTEMEGNGQIEELRESLKYENGNYSINDYVPVFSTISGDVFNPWFSNYITRTCLTTNDDKTEEGRSRLAGTQAMLMTDHDIWGTYDQNILISLRAKAGDYEHYTDDPTAVELQTRILFELIEDTVADQEILNGAICLEIAPEEGQVFSALYSDTAYEFYYGHADNGSEGRVDISRRHEGARASKAIGYYGVESLTHVTYVPVTGLDLGELTYDNGDVLSYHLSVKQIEGIDLDILDYTITVYDTATSRKALEFTVSGNGVKEKQPDIMDNMVECPTTRYDAFGNSKNLGSYRIPIYKERIGDEETDGLGFILDAADISAMTILLDANGEDEGYKIRNGTGTDGTFCQSLSFFRFGTWTEIEGAWTDNIFVEITVNSDELDEPAVARSKSTSPYFADASTERKRPQDNSGANNYKTYGITNCRHFYNIRYYEDLEITTLGLPNAHANELSKFRIDFVLRNDLDWGEFARTSLYASSSKYYSDQIQDHKAIGFDFPSFKELRVYDYLIGLDEAAAQAEVDRLAAEYPNYGFADTDALTKALESDWKVHDPAYAAEETSKTITIPDLIEDNLQLSHSISNLSISMKSNMVYGLYRDYASKRDKPTGLFLENHGVVKYFAIDQSKIVGSNKVGAICGANSGTILYSGTLSTRTDEHPDPTIVQGIKYVGGVFGYQASIGLPDWTMGYRDLTISYLENHARVLGTEYVGGITSCVTNGNDTRINDTGSDTEDYAGIRNIMIKYCENYGQVRGVYAPRTEDSPAPDPADEEAMLQYRQSVRYIGGIVGYMNNCGSYIKNSETSNLWPEDYRYNNNRIVYCYSYPVYDETYDKDILDELNQLAQLKHYQLAEADQEELLQLMQDYNVGYCVGGIVGYGNQLVIDNCGVRVKDDKIVNGYGEEITGGYVFGDQYVGGIIGFNDSYLNDACINACSVVGNYYVGGIIGMNIHAVVQSTEEERKELVVPDLDGTVIRTGTNWAHSARSVNKGNVYGLYDYAGGVAGYSAGLLGTSRSEKLGDIRPIIMGRNYVGGITGRSVKGSLGGNGCNVEADINGENYVGGLVGYIGPNDPCPAEWSTYNSGNVYANGSFAGGIAGVIMNPGAYTGNRRVSRPNSITAKYYVGGITGANVMNPTSDLSPNYYVEKNNNGELHATAFAGGYIGLNIFYSISNEDAERMIAELAALDRMGDALVGTNEGRSMKDVVSLVHNLESQFGSNPNSMEMKQNGLKCFLSAISPIMEEGYEHELVYAAGVVGYNAEQSIMNFNDFKWEYHKVDLITTTGIDVEEQVYDPETHSIITKTVKHAYTGSIIGINNRLSTISGARGFCKFSTRSSYRGGLCEVNYGTIMNPYTANSNYVDMYYSDDPEINYVGAVCGRNDGDITVGMLQALRLKGTGVMGIVAAENYGTIHMTDPTISSVQITGADNGAVAGILVGRNLGNLDYAAASPLTIMNNSFVTCGDCVGGLIGEQVGPITLQKVENTMNDNSNSNRCIRAINGTCGSLIGRLIVKDGDTLIEGYQFGKDRDIYGKSAGGIIGSIVLTDEHKVVIKDSKVSRMITGTGADSMAAGIAASVQAASPEVTGYVLIRNCIVAAEVSNETDAARSAGIVYDAGGRTVIDGCRVYCPKAGHGITATPALAIMNCFDGTLKGSELFGSVNAPSPDTIRNNYCMFRSKNYVPAVTGAFPEDYAAVFLEKPVQWNTYKNNGVYEIYATYETIDSETGDVAVVTCDSGIRVSAPDSNPGDLSYYYNDYNKGSTWKKMDDAFMEYMVTHSVPCDY